MHEGGDHDYWSAAAEVVGEGADDDGVVGEASKQQVGVLKGYGAFYALDVLHERRCPQSGQAQEHT